MDGSADLKWRLYESRRGTSGRGRQLGGFSGYNSNIPYNSWSSATDIRVPRSDINIITLLTRCLLSTVLQNKKLNLILIILFLTMF